MSHISGANSATVEERGVTYRLVLPEPAKPVVIGIKRHGGLYCTACEISLLKEGEESARYAGKVHFAECPLCDAPSVVGDVVVECSCFDWRMAPHRLTQKNVRNLKVVDTYGTTFGVQFFVDTIVHAACPVQLYDQIGSSGMNG